MVNARVIMAVFLSLSASFAWATECYDIGVTAIEQDKQNLGQEWLAEAWRRVSETDKKDNLYILKKLADISYKIGSCDEAAAYAREGISLDPNRKDELMIFSHPKGNTTSQKKVVMNRTYLNYTRLCADEKWVNPTWQELKCFVTDNGHPLLLLQPIKVEEIKKNPDVAIFHDFVSDYEIELIKFVTKSKLERSTIRVSAAKQIANERRVSKGVFFKTKAVFVQRLKERVAAATGLSVRRGSEPLQVVNYGVGGFYIPHLDAWDQQNDFRQDNRIATVLMYLSDVHAGGATVFPNIELKIEARKGSVAFWYNLYRNLRVNHYTRHAACPVMVGSKWVANFWIHRYWNEFTRKCGLSIHEY